MVSGNRDISKLLPIENKEPVFSVLDGQYEYAQEIGNSRLNPCTKYLLPAFKSNLGELID